MNYEIRACNEAIELRAEADEAGRRLAGYAAVYDALSENLGGFRERIDPGAFDGVLDNDVRALVNHDASQVLGRTRSGTLRLATDDRGLRYSVDLPDTSYADDLYQAVQRGDVSQSSFAFTVDDDNWTEDDDGRLVRTIKKVRRLYDVSPVTFPAYPQTEATARALSQASDQIKRLQERYAARLWLIANA